MKIRNVNDVIRSTTRSDVIENNIKKITSNTTSSLSKFLDAQPMKTKWYHIDQYASTVGKGFNDTAGPYDGGIKYTVIDNYVVYNYLPERAVDLEKEENMRLRYRLENMTLIHLPNTLTPSVGDRLSFYVEDNRFLYKVLSSVPVTFNNKPFIKTDISKCDIKSADYYEEDFRKDGLISNDLEFIEGNVGTKYTPFMASGDIDKINKLEAYKKEILDQYNDFFYDEDKNIYSSFDTDRPGFITYTPLLIDLQMEFRTLWTFGINTILTHETLVNKRSKYTYNKHVVRRFLNRLDGAWESIRDNGIAFTGYQYSNTIINPMYKIQSALNDSSHYYIYDYYQGTDVLYDDQGKIIMEISNKTTVNIPETLFDLFEKYTKDEIEIDWFLDWLSEFDFEVCFCCMLRVFIVMTIIDKMVDKYKGSDKNKGILT